MDDKDEDSCGYNENVSDTYGSQWMEDIEGGSCLSLFRPVTGHRDYHWETADKEVSLLLLLWPALSRHQN